MERAASQWAADWIIWTHSPAGSPDKFTVTHTQTETHTHTPFLFGILPCLPRCSSEYFPLPLCYALSVSNKLSFSFWFPSLFSVPILSFSSLFLPHNNSFLWVCCGSLSFLAALIFPNTVVFILSLLALLSVVISLSHFLSVSLPFQISVETSFNLFQCLCISPYSLILFLYLPPSHCPALSFSTLFLSH